MVRHPSYGELLRLTEGHGTSEIYENVRDLEAEAALWRTNLEDAQSDLAGEVEAHRLEREARVRAEGERDERLAQLLYTRDERDANFRLLVEANVRAAALETALRAADHALEGSQQFMLSTVAALGLPASDVPAATRSLMFEVTHTLEQARAALPPPERSRVAAAPEPPGADDTPRGA